MASIGWLGASYGLKGGCRWSGAPARMRVARTTEVKVVFLLKFCAGTAAACVPVLGADEGAQCCALRSVAS